MFVKIILWVKFTLTYKYHFEVNNSLAFNTFTFYTHPSIWFWNIVIIPKGDPTFLKQSFPILPSPQPLATINPSVCLGIPVLNVSYKWIHTLFVFFCLSLHPYGLIFLRFIHVVTFLCEHATFPLNMSDVWDFSHWSIPICPQASLWINQLPQYRN